MWVIKQKATNEQTNQPQTSQTHATVWRLPEGAGGGEGDEAGLWVLGAQWNVSMTHLKKLTQVETGNRMIPVVGGLGGAQKRKEPKVYPEKGTCDRSVTCLSTTCKKQPVAGRQSGLWSGPGALGTGPAPAPHLRGDLRRPLMLSVPECSHPSSGHGHSLEFTGLI